MRHGPSSRAPWLIVRGSVTGFTGQFSKKIASRKYSASAARTRHLLHKEYRVPKIFSSSLLFLFPLRFPSSSIKSNRRPPVSRGHETFVDERHKYGFLLTQVNRVWPAGSTGICTVLFGRRFQTGEGGAVIRGPFSFSSLYYHRIFPLERRKNLW